MLEVVYSSCNVSCWALLEHGSYDDDDDDDDDDCSTWSYRDAYFRAKMFLEN